MSESGGNNLAATFSPELADLTIYMVDAAEGEKVPRKGGPDITRSDLLIINKIDLAPLVGADLGLNGSGYTKMRGLGPFVFSNLESGERVEPIANFIIEKGRLAKTAAWDSNPKPQQCARFECDDWLAASSACVSSADLTAHF